MKKDFIINFQGTDFVRYEGLLDEAHAQGLKRISTTLIQIPTQDNGNVAIVAAEVETEKGVFSGIGDASPSNVNRMIAPHIIRQAETRAKARALRDAVNIGVTAIEELGDLDASAHGQSNHQQPAAQQRPETGPDALGPDPFNAPNQQQSAGGMTDNQRKAVYAMSKKLGMSQPPDTHGFTKQQASDLIESMQAKIDAGVRA